MQPAYHALTPLPTVRVLHPPDEAANLDFLRGSVLDVRPIAPWVFEIELDAEQPPHFIGGLIPMMSDRLLGVLLDTGIDNVQTFPALLRTRSAEWRHHSVFNVVGLVDATDLELSQGTVVGENVDGPTRIDFRTLVLSREQTRSLPLFRLFHDPGILLVDDRVMRALDVHRPKEGWGFSAFEIEVS